MLFIKTLFTVLIYLVLNYFSKQSNASPISDNLVNTALNGEELVKMGTVLKKPLLSLLGETFITLKKDFEDKNLKEKQEFHSEFCKLRICTDWTEWTSCSTIFPKTFGSRSRTRTCDES